jgi:hypothetical protein
MTRGSADSLDLVHPLNLNRGRLLAGPLDLQEYSPTPIYTKQVWHSCQLVRPPVDLHDPPAFGLCHLDDGFDDG